MSEILFEGDIWETEEQLLETEHGQVFLPKLAMSGVKAIETGPGSDFAEAFLRNAKSGCGRVIELIEIHYHPVRELYFAFIDLKTDADQAADYAASDRTLAGVIDQVLEYVWINHTDECFCESPAQHPEFN